MRSRRAELALGLLAHGVGHAGLARSSCGTRRPTEPSSSPSSRRIDSICLRRTYSRCCLAAPSSTSSRMRLRTCSSARRSRWSASASSRRSVTSRVSSSSTLLLEGQVGRVAGGVGQRAGLGDRAHEGGDAAVVAAQLEDLLDRRRGTRARARACGRRRGTSSARSVDLDAQAPGAVGVRRRRRCRGATPSSIAPRRAAGQAHALGRRAAIVPTVAYSPSWRGTSRTRSSPPTSTGSVTSIVGKTTVSSSGMRSRRGH